MMGNDGTRTCFAFICASYLYLMDSIGDAHQIHQIVFCHAAHILRHASASDAIKHDTKCRRPRAVTGEGCRWEACTGATLLHASITKQQRALGPNTVAVYTTRLYETRLFYSHVYNSSV